MATFWRRWSYRPYFATRAQTIHFPLGNTEADVRKALNDRHGRDNWMSDSLKKEGKVKEHNATPRW